MKQTEIIRFFTLSNIYKTIPDWILELYKVNELTIKEYENLKYGMPEITDKDRHLITGKYMYLDTE